MTKILKNCLIATAMLLMAGAGFVACSNGSSQAGASEDPNQFTASIEGVVEKGPFVKGTTVTLYELNPETFAQTGRVFTGTVDRDNGSFALEKIELESPYVLVEANGYYWSELSGRKSNNSLKLKAVAHVEESSNININVGTHLTSSRILDLVDSGMDFDKAKVQAESELMKAFFGEESKTELEKASIFDNEKLLALSLIVLMSGSEADVTEALANISENFTDEAVLTKQADNSAMQYASYGKAREFMQEKFPDVQIGLFENQIETFWKRVYGIGECDKSKEGLLDTINAEKSSVRGSILVCRDVGGAYRWFWATDLEISTAGFVGVENGKIVRSVADSTKAYVYDKDGWREATDLDFSVENCEPVEDGRLIFSISNPNKAYVYDKDGWREATEVELKVGEACTESRNGTFAFVLNSDYICKGGWTYAWIHDFAKESYFNSDVKYGSVKDERDGHVYKTVKIDGKTWMAENLAYVTDGARCEDSLTVGCDYAWKAALSVAEEDTVLKDNHGICMDGWHIPDTTEWNALVEAHSLEDLLSETGWLSGKNGTGFSMVPTDYMAGAGHVMGYNESAMADFTTSNAEISSSVFYPFKRSLLGLSVSFTNEKYSKQYQSTTKYTQGYSYETAAVRCVKDSE